MADELRKRLAEVMRQTKLITTIDEQRTSSGADLTAQSAAIANQIRLWIDGGYDPVNLIRMLLCGAVFIGDNYRVSRNQMAQVCLQAKLPADASLIFKPGG